MEKFQKLDSFHIKIFAIIFMIIDHLGLFFFKDVIILRYIGRASFILFAFLCAESMHYGKHKERYIISFYAFEIIYSLIEYIFTKQYTSSIFITLALGSTTIYFLQKQKPYLKLLAILPIMYAIFASFNYTKINVLYGIYGVLIIVGFYLVRLFLK